MKLSERELKLLEYMYLGLASRIAMTSTITTNHNAQKTIFIDFCPSSGLNHEKVKPIYITDAELFNEKIVRQRLVAYNKNLLSEEVLKKFIPENKLKSIMPAWAEYATNFANLTELIKCFKSLIYDNMDEVGKRVIQTQYENNLDILIKVGTISKEESKIMCEMFKNKKTMDLVNV